MSGTGFNDHIPRDPSNSKTHAAHSFVSVPVEERRRLFLLAEQNAKKVLKPGDRIRVSKCPGTKRWITFAGWDGHWIVSKSGINDFSPGAVDRLNGEPVDFNTNGQPGSAP